MELFIIAILAVCGLLYCNAYQRGLNLVKAYMFLMYLDHGETIQNANKIVHMNDDVNSFMFRAKDHVQNVFNGSQLALIAYAKNKGYQNKKIFKSY